MDDLDEPSFRFTRNFRATEDTLEDTFLRDRLGKHVKQDQVFSVVEFSTKVAGDSVFRVLDIIDESTTLWNYRRISPSCNAAASIN
jgi:hypothetical protein